jgi:hypothetical protein
LAAHAPRRIRPNPGEETSTIYPLRSTGIGAERQAPYLVLPHIILDLWRYRGTCRADQLLNIDMSAANDTPKRVAIGKTLLARTGRFF